MPLNNTEHNSFTRDEELFLLLERDIPEMSGRLGNMEGKQTLIETGLNDCKQGIAVLSTKVDNLATEVKSMYNKDTLPWYKDFQKILILLLVVGFMAIAGVKGADTLISNLNPLPENTGVNQ